MNFKDLEKLYLEKKQQFGTEAYKHISELLEEAKEVHKADWQTIRLLKETMNRLEIV